MKVQRQVRNSIKTCDGLRPILGILDRLNPAVDIVVSSIHISLIFVIMQPRIRLNRFLLTQRLANTARLLPIWSGVGW